MINFIIITLGIVSVASILSSIYKDRMYQNLIKEYTEERKDLLNRIMARNLGEYKNITNDSLPKGRNRLREKTEESEFGGLYK